MSDKTIRMMYVLDGPGASAPVRAHTNDAGYDLFVSETVEVGPSEFVDVPTGVKVHLPEHTWGLLTGRSSTLRKRGLLVAQGVIDQGYRGELYSGVWNLTDEPVIIEKGDRIAQLIVMPMVRGLAAEQVITLEADAEGRNSNGFGSTGR